MLNKDQRNDFYFLLPGQSSEAGNRRNAAAKASESVEYADYPPSYR